MARGFLTVVAKNVFSIDALENLVRVAVRSAFQTGDVVANIIPNEFIKEVGYIDDGSPPTVEGPSPTVIPSLAPTPFPLLTIRPVAVSASTNAPSSEQTATTLEPTNSLIQLTESPSRIDTIINTTTTELPTVSTNVSNATFPPFPKPASGNDEEDSSPTRWWIWLLIGVGGVALVIFVLTLCEQVDRSSGVSPKKKRSDADSADSRVGSTYIPPTGAAQAAAAHLRKQQSSFRINSTKSQDSRPEQPNPFMTRGGNSASRQQDSFYGEDDDEEYESDMVELVEEEEEDESVSNEIAGQSTYVGDTNETSYGSSY